MKKTFYFLLFSISITSFGQSDDEKNIKNIMATQNEAWNRGDVDAFMIGYWESDSLMFIGSSGITYGYKNTLANYKKRYPDAAAMGKLTFTLIQVQRMASKFFHVIGKWQLIRSIGDVGGHFTLVFKKIKGRWVIISDHSS